MSDTLVESTKQASGERLTPEVTERECLASEVTENELPTFPIDERDK